MITAPAQVAFDRPSVEPVPRTSLTRIEVAESMGGGIRTIDSLIADRSSGFPILRIGSRVLIPTDALKAWLAGQVNSGGG